MSDTFQSGSSGNAAASDPFADWSALPHLPVLLLDEPPGAQIILAMLQEVAVEFVYWGGSTPGTTRTVRPLEVYRNEEAGPIYVRAWCELREAQRVFRLDRIRLLPAETWSI